MPDPQPHFVGLALKGLNKQIEGTEQYKSLNGSPKYIHEPLLKNILKKTPRKENNFVNEDNIPKIWLHLQYMKMKVKIEL